MKQSQNKKFDKYGNEIVKGETLEHKAEVESKTKFRESLEKVLSSKFKPTIMLNEDNKEQKDKSNTKIVSSPK